MSSYTCIHKDTYTHVFKILCSKWIQMTLKKRAKKKKKNDCSEIDFYGFESNYTLKASSLEYNLNRIHERQSANQSAFDNLLNKPIDIYKYIVKNYRYNTDEGIKRESVKFTFIVNENSKLLLFVSLFNWTQNVYNILFKFSRKKKYKKKKTDQTI